jgi:GMP synthase-like glutamine amidotransferase
MATVALLHHLSRPFPGHMGTALRAAGARLDERDLLGGDALPELDGLAGLVSYGGEQSVVDLDRHPYLVAEVDLLREAVAREVPVFGICLGGQLLAHALDGTVSKLPRPLLEWAAVDPLPAAAEDPVFAGWPPGARTLHWHEDAFSLPPGAVELTTRGASGVEAFRAGSCAWGIQFHPEVNAADIDHWYGESPGYLAALGITAEQARAADARFLPEQETLAHRLFEGFARVVAGDRAARTTLS